MARVKGTSSKTTPKVKSGGKPIKSIDRIKKPKSSEDGIKKKTRKSDEHERKKRRYKASTISKREQKLFTTGKRSTDLLIQKKPVEALIRETIQKYNNVMRIQGKSVRVIHEGLEAFLVDIIRGTKPLCILANRMAPTDFMLRISASPYFGDSLPKAAVETGKFGASSKKSGKGGGGAKGAKNAKLTKQSKHAKSS